jgi:hypothetical protein
MFAAKVARPQAKAASRLAVLQRSSTSSVHAPRDRFEHEAEQTAQHVTSTPRSAGAVLPIQRLPGQHAGGVPASVERVLSRPGSPLEPALRRDMEQRFGHDFSQVRVHADAAAARSARDLHARAYTVGHDIVVGAHPEPRLLAHELTHVVQQTSHVALQRAPVTMDDDYVIHESAMELVEGKLLELYEALPRAERIELKANGTVAIGMVTERGKAHEPRMVFTTNGNSASPAFREAASRLKLTEWIGDAGVTRRQGGTVTHPRTGGVPPGTGGIEHAEQLMIGYAEDHGYLVHGMAVSRRLCHDCPIVLRAHKGGRLMVTVILDPDPTLPNVRQERAQLAQARAQDAAEEEASGGRGRERTSGGGARGRREQVTRPLAGRGTTRDTSRSATGLRGGRAVEITPERRGGGGGEVAAPPTPSRPTRVEVLAPLPRNVTEGRGAPVAPITIPEPAIRLRSVGGAIEGAGVAMVAMQVSSLRSAELQKATARFEQLKPEIERYRNQGYGVQLTLVVEWPNQLDIAALWAGIGDPGQVVYFNRMFISSAVKPGTEEQKYPVVRENVAPGDPLQRDPHEMTLEQQVRAQTGDPYPVPGTAPKKGFHFVIGTMNIPAAGAVGPRPAQQAAPQTDLRGIAGTYHPKVEKIFSGSYWSINLLVGRQLQVELDANGNPQPKMWRLGTTPRLFTYRPYALQGKIVMGGQFAVGPGRPPAGEELSSRMEYPRQGLIFEWVKELDSGLNEVSDSLVSWHKI